MTDPLRIVVTGLAATFPHGGVFWDYVQYPLGLLRLGHDVLYLEDTGRWCYDPSRQTFAAGGRQNASRLARALTRLEPNLAERWFYRDATGATFGRSWDEVVAFCRSADLFLHVSASCWMREEYFAATTTAFIDSDPMFTQASVPDYLSGELDPSERERVEMLAEHDVFFTFGENVGAPNCHIPTEMFDWMPTRQPVVLDLFRDVAIPPKKRRRRLSTVATWERIGYGPTVGGVKYGGKSREFLRFIDLPARSPIRTHLALSGMAPFRKLRAHGWILDDADEVSRNPWTYRDYLAASLGEWSVAKGAYVASRSGWFSCRTACYLAMGVPAVVQDTGFGVAIPAGEGVLAFGDLEGAVAAIEEVVSHPERHSKAAAAIAKEYFDSDLVLSRLVEAAMNRDRRRRIA